jgi:hypothetical protein
MMERMSAWYEFSSFSVCSYSLSCLLNQGMLNSVLVCYFSTFFGIAMFSIFFPLKLHVVYVLSTLFYLFTCFTISFIFLGICFLITVFVIMILPKIDF